MSLNRRISKLEAKEKTGSKRGKGNRKPTFREWLAAQGVRVDNLDPQIQSFQQYMAAKSDLTNKQKPKR